MIQAMKRLLCARSSRSEGWYQLPWPGLIPAALLAGALLCLGGCTRSTLRAGEVPTSRPIEGIGQGFFEERVEAFVVPPQGWERDPPKTSDRHTHLVWLSPTGDTAYGVIYMKLPIPLLATRPFHNTVLNRFLQQMRADQGEATLLEKQWQPDARRMDFEAEGGLYRIDASLIVRGMSGWAVYTGVLREGEENPEEIELGDRARRETKVGRDAAG